MPSIVTVKVALTVLPASSMAVYVTFAVPTSKLDPGLRLEVSVTVPEVSVGSGFDHVTTAVAKPLSVFWVISGGIPVIDGFCKSE